ncbi:hypothetical protein, partial [Intestinibacter sp.]
QEESRQAYEKGKRMNYKELVRACKNGTLSQKTGYNKALKEMIKELSKDMSYDELVYACESASVPVERKCYGRLVIDEIDRKSKYMSDREVADKFEDAFTSIEKNGYAKVLEKRGYLEKNSEGKYKRTSKRL